MTPTDDTNVSGTVFNIQKYSVHDGPGIRTVVFLKGCPLRCDWCSNPESQATRIQLAYNTGRCLGLSQCVRCVEMCLSGAISRGKDDRIVIDRALCAECTRDCTCVCPSNALITYGARRTVAEVLRTVEQDSLFYARSGGGMTLSGGEPLMQGDFALALLREARKRRIGAAVETCGHVQWEILDEACRLSRTLLFDIKHVNQARHEAGTGVTNTLILENFRRVMEHHPKLHVMVRTPVIPGFNDDDEAISAILDALEPYPHVDYSLLPYHRLGTQKYHFLGRETPMGEVKLDDERMASLSRLVAARRG
ncbi:glycyl-radical enzyme activating protein [Nitratidesulfovibrio sp. HK-II]|uniref:(2S)-3-sulfopropanediol dehydratase activating enzyme n=1 Tax=Nitratidesulfovibrio sp. HK-II TaxID=2009266 RepID=UPI000E2F551F|nr:glycyl-radical enzyme activating protein [Nitratidesulfovibrio sp. HK-II]GBO96334.1 pyruvate formate-lyase activating enzyme [Nitratidesulfovibrio sp. HK-II]